MLEYKATHSFAWMDSLRNPSECSGVAEAWYTLQQLSNEPYRDRALEAASGCFVLDITYRPSASYGACQDASQRHSYAVPINTTQFVQDRGGASLLLEYDCTMRRL